MEYTFRTKSEEKIKSKEIFLAPGINSFCVDEFGYYEISFSGCHSYDESTPSSFKTGADSPVNVKAVKHRNGIRILSDIKSTFKVLVENENGEKSFIVFIEEPTKINGKHAYKFDFDLKPLSKLVVTPQSETALFNPESKAIFGANDCTEVIILDFF